MKQAGQLMMWLVVLGGVSQARAQLILNPQLSGMDNLLRVTRNNRNPAFSAYLAATGHSGSRSLFPSTGLSVSRVTTIYFSGVPIVTRQPPLVVVVKEPAQAVPPEERPGFLVIKPKQQQPKAPEEPAPKAEAPEPPLPGAPASVFRPVGPAERAQAREPLTPEMPIPVEPPPRPRPRPPAATPKEESARLIDLGKEGLAAQEYGRAERLFRQASGLEPKDVQALFLLAQAQFALAKYHEAVASIHAGMRLRLDWPSARFPPRDLYGPNGADFDEQLKRLQEVVNQNPKDPVVLFLLAYQLWFDGDKAQARKLFERAAPAAADKTFINRFLQAIAAGPVVFLGG